MEKLSSGDTDSSVDSGPYIERTVLQVKGGGVLTDVPWKGTIRVVLKYALAENTYSASDFLGLGLVSGSSVQAYLMTDIFARLAENKFFARSYGATEYNLTIPPIMTPRTIDFDIDSYCKQYDEAGNIIDDLTIQSTVSTAANGTINVFGATREGGIQIVSCPVRAYSADIYDEHTLLRKLRPALVNNKVGMSCEVTGNFFEATPQDAFIFVSQ